MIPALVILGLSSALLALIVYVQHKEIEALDREVDDAYKKMNALENGRYLMERENDHLQSLVILPIDNPFDALWKEPRF